MQASKTAAEDILRASNEIQAASGNISSRIPKFWDGKVTGRTLTACEQLLYGK
jgi:hypothetical protein